MKQTNKQHEESGCTDYLQHSADNCPLLTASGAPETPTGNAALERQAQYNRKWHAIGQRTIPAEKPTEDDRRNFESYWSHKTSIELMHTKAQAAQLAECLRANEGDQ